MKIKAGIENVGYNLPAPHSQSTKEAASELHVAPSELNSQQQWAHHRLQELLSESTTEQTQRILSFLVQGHEYVAPRKKELPWPKWDGKPESLFSFLFEVEVKIEEDREILGSNRAICLRMLGTLPPAKKHRVTSWFRKGGDDGTFDWREFLNHFGEKFEDKKTYIEARNAFMHMTQGAHQYFKDFVEDFEYKLSQCGGDDWDSFTKIAILDAKLNPALQKCLTPVNRPDEWNYSQWVGRLKEIAARLETRPQYRPNDAAEVNTYYLTGLEVPETDEGTSSSKKSSERKSPQKEEGKKVLTKGETGKLAKTDGIKNLPKAEESGKGKAPQREESGTGKASQRADGEKMARREEQLEETTQGEGSGNATQIDGEKEPPGDDSKTSEPAIHEVTPTIDPTENQEEQTTKSSKPRAPWRSKTEFHRLMHRRRCIRCKKSGHIARFCPTHLAPLRPAGLVLGPAKPSRDESESSVNSHPTK
ncbi:hypothetical protein K3495_g12844 [Podosphaera aphanis]|nr:hypothetical protein K3495_g12844 [Podosphaera aphanis]